MTKILTAVNSLKLPDWWIGAGFVRSKIWDYLHGYTKRSPLPDIDVIYFDKSDTREIQEKKYELLLKNINPELKWSVKNQARMHILHNDPPYKDSTQALSKWVETATCIGVRIEKDGSMIITAPHGIEDLVHLILRPSPDAEIEVFQERMQAKQWTKKWPKLRVEL